MDEKKLDEEGVQEDERFCPPSYIFDCLFQTSKIQSQIQPSQIRRPLFSLSRPIQLFNSHLFFIIVDRAQNSVMREIIYFKLLFIF